MVTAQVPIIIADNDTEGISRTLLLETTLCVLRGEIIKYAASQKRQREREFKELDKEINDMISNFDALNEEEKDTLVMLKVQIEGTDIGKSYWKCRSDLFKDEQFKEMVTAQVPIIIADNDTEGISRTLLLETTLCVSPWRNN